MKKNRTKGCLLCGARLVATPAPADGEDRPELWEHPASETCAVRLTDAFGISVDGEWHFDEDRSIRPVGAKEESSLVQVWEDTGETEYSLVPSFVSAELIVDRIFANAGLAKLGGASGDRGWSSLSAFQRCPYLWKRRYVDKVDRGVIPGAPGPTALEVGSLVHVLLAIYYSALIEAEASREYPLTPEGMRDALIAGNVTPDHVNEAWRLFYAYTAYYGADDFDPLAVEYHVVDPRTGRSCRWDLVAWKRTTTPGMPEGTYLIDHKTKSRFDAAMLRQWPNDGELIGQWDQYVTLGFEKRFGPLRGLIVNIIGRQKEPKFERVTLFPSQALLRDHRKSLKIWSAAIDSAKATGVFPRARASCVGQYGLCDQFDHCTMQDVDA